MNTINQQLSRLNSCTLLATLLSIQLDEVTENYFSDDFTQYADTINSLEYSLKQLKRIQKEITLLTEQYQQAVKNETTSE